MPSIAERPRKNAPSKWQCTVRHPNAPTIVRTFDSKELAARFGEKVETRLRRLWPEQPKPKAAPLLANESLAKLIDDLLASSEVANRHKSSAPTVRRNVGNATVEDVTRRWTKEFVRKMRAKRSMRGRPFSYETIVHHLAIIRQAIRARADHLETPCPAFPFSERSLPRGWKNKRERRLSNDEQRALFSRLRRLKTDARPHYLALVRLALETGARQQELVFAEWSEFDMEKGIWVIPAAHAKGNRSRFVPLTRRARRLLKVLAAFHSSASARVLWRLSQPHTVSTMFARFAKEAGLHNFRFHDLRHEAISRMILFKRKLSTFEIMRIVGHSSLDMLNRYANLRGEELVGRMD
ncbi:site-specific integrase [Caballeronia sordidicola]|uniref:Integrase n=1 Tax=Caballeronia sordidicola TaxID=196367 RepID=A0A226WWX2_CABSO|nr:site-specific integrase [Caballeronia sordidicola]OXC75674.1 Integrase [Caballeronia sordidicola]